MPVAYEPGMMVRGYRIVKQLGCGNYATSYEAQDISSGRKVFFKQYSDPTEIMGEIFTRFVAQQRLLQMLLAKISAAETIYDTFEQEGIHHQAKEFMLGQDLRSYFTERGAIPLEERRLIAAVSLYGLLQVHANGIVHNDLKPEQLYLQEDPTIAMRYRVKITDFDFCTIEGQYEPVYRVSTPYYSSPEYLRGVTTTKASDAFTMGIVLYELLTGDVPYTASTPEDYASQVLSYKARRPREINPALAPDLDEMLFRLLDPDAANRPSLEEVHKLLLGEVVTVETTETAPAPAEAAPPSAPVEVAPPATPSVVARRIELVSDDSPLTISVHKSMVIGRDLCRHLPDYRYVAPEQFELRKGPERWVIVGLAAVNKTYLNGDELTGTEVELHDGDEIFVGNLGTDTGLRLRVRFVP
ncbi:MAG: FHA domain-containing serine/threonine-protein kinase [candidate division WOR-3 bacterium]